MNDQQAYDFYADPAHLVPAGQGRRRKRPILARRRAVQIESRPSGSHVLSVRLPAAMAEELLAVVSGKGSSISAVVREVIGRYLADRRRMAWLDEHRHELEVVPGSGRLVTPRAIPSTLTLSGPGARTFGCPHMSVSNVTSASCGQCGPMSAAA